MAARGPCGFPIGARPLRRISHLLFLGALVLAGYVAGSATDRGRDLLTAAERAFEGAWRSIWPRPIRWLGDFVDDIPASEAAAHRVRLLAPTLAGSVLMVGGRHMFLDRCPGFVGCVALEYDRHGRFVHAYPFRPEAYEAVLVADALPGWVGNERALGFDFAKDADVFSIDRYSNGDLAVVLFSRASFPSGLGVARIDREGWPRWFRADNSHHWPTVAHGRLRGAGAGLDDALVLPGRRVRAGMARGRRVSHWETRFGRMPCASHFEDYLQVLDGAGALLWQASVAEALRRSRHASMLNYSHSACNVLHLNSVEVLPTPGPHGLAAGDFLVSLRDLGALAVLDGRDGSLKRIWRGSFYGQHGARALEGPAGPTFLLFDNWGREGEYGPGRLLALDPRSGGEQTIYPNAASPATVAQIGSNARGGVTVAPDGSRAIVFSYDAGQAVEVDLASGEATAVFQPLDDVTMLRDDSQALAYRWKLRDVRYVVGTTDDFPD